MLASINFSKSLVFLICCLVFIISIALASFLPQEFLNHRIWLFGVGIFFLILTILFWKYNKDIGLKPISLFFLLISIIFLAVWRYGVSSNLDNTADKIRYYNGQTITVVGFISNEPDIRENNQKLEIDSNGVCEQSKRNICEYRKISGKILVTANLYPEYKYGDLVKMTCELKQPEEYKGFAYDRYLGRYNIYSVCYYPKNLSLTTFFVNNESKKINWKIYVYSKIFILKQTVTDLINSSMSEPESSLARPIIFGGQQGLDKKIKMDFQKVGLTHIMAVSGFNVSILAIIVMTILLGIGLERKYAFYIAIIFLIAYIILVGAPGSAMRAGLMGFLALWALKLGRLNKMTNSLALTATILLAINPKLLRDDIGFQLSFLAIAGLVYIYPLLDAIWLKNKLSKLKGISDALLITLSAQIFTLPILAYNFSQISLIAPLANMAVLWTLPILTILTLIALCLSFIIPSLSFLFFLPSYVFAKYILVMVEFLAKIPYGYMEIDYAPWLLVAIYYVLVIIILCRLNFIKKFY